MVAAVMRPTRLRRQVRYSPPAAYIPPISSGLSRNLETLRPASMISWVTATRPRYRYTAAPDRELMAKTRRKASAAVQSPLETYLREINETPLLSADDEHELAIRIGEG